MKRLRTLISEVRLELDTNKASVLDDRLIVEWINEQRSIWLKNEYNKGRSVEDNTRQTIYNMPIVLVDANDFDTNIVSDIILKSKYNVPMTIELMYSDMITSVRSTNIRKEKYNYINRTKIATCGNGKFNSTATYATLYDSKMYILTTKNNPTINMINMIAIEGVFEDPRQVFELNKKLDTTYESNTNTLDMIYPISESMWTYIKGTILQLNGIPTINNQKQNDSTTSPSSRES